MRRVAATLLVAWMTACTHAPSDPSKVAADKELDDSELIGTTPPEWTTSQWIHPPEGADGTPGKGTSLAQLRGRVVLVRWFMGTSCPFCSVTLPAMQRMHEDYAARGLVVVGLYHHKEEGPLRPGQYEEYVRSYGITFATARDPDWTTLNRWWLTRDRDWTSASFLIDRSGKIRGVHPGGKYAIGEPGYDAMRRAIEKLLAEPAPRAPQPNATTPVLTRGT